MLNIHSHYFYIGILLISIAGLVLADWRLRLAFFHNSAAAAKTVGVTGGLLLLFDIFGIRNGIFSTNQRYVVGIHIVSRSLPIEELLFLFLLCYITLVLYQLLKVRLKDV